MANEKNEIIQYQGSQINLFMDDKSDCVSLTDMAKAFKGKKSIESWMRNKNTLSFLAAWEKFHNPDYLPHGFVGLLENAGKQHFNLSIKQWIDATKAIGIFTKSGIGAGTYAHKDIALKFASWLSADFELFLIKEVQRLKELDHQRNSFELLNHEQVLAVVRLKEVFKYVANQEAAEKAHKDVFASKSDSANPFAEFNKFRNEILDISKQKIDERIKQYCIDNNIASANKLLKLSKHEQILRLDTYEAVRNAVWDFLELKGEINALNLANLAGNMIRIEQGQVLRKNEDNLFDKKQDLGPYTEFHKLIDEAPEVKTARQILEWREQQIKLLQSQSMPFGEIIKRIAKAGKPNLDANYPN